MDGTFPLHAGARQIGTLTVDAPESVLRRIQVRIVPSLEALLAAALERDALMADAVETAALRRSDVIKTALLRSVSHDLRSPLTAILTSAEALRIDPSGHEPLAAAITEEATRLSRLIDNLLDLSRLEADAADAIVRGFVEADGGRVWVESLPDQATSFVVELPVTPPQSA